jgi:predicted ester cyclase
MFVRDANFLTKTFLSYFYRFNGEHDGLDKVGHEGFARMVSGIHAALAEYHCEIHSMVVEGNKAFCRLRFSGRHCGNLMGYPPTQQVVSWMGATEFTCINGKILKVWELGDMKTLEEQLQVQCMQAALDEEEED